MEIAYAGFSDIGKVANIMEDFIDVFELNGIKFFCVADGLGGVKGSNIASNIAIYEIKEYLTGVGYFDYTTLEAHMNFATTIVNKILIAFQMANPKVYGKFSTALTIIAVNQCFESMIFHIGNTRAYLVREGIFYQLTRDDTVAQDLLEKNKITTEEYAQHPERGILTKVLGSDNSSLAKTSGTFSLNDTLIMMTNGVYEIVSNNDIRDIIVASNNAPLQDIATNIIKTVNEISGIDNSAIMIATFIN